MPQRQGQQEVIDELIDTLEHLDINIADWRSKFTGVLPSATFDRRIAALDPLASALDLAASTATDGEQRAVELPDIDLDGLLELRLALRDRLAAEPEGSALRHVLPWIWRWESLGKPLTAIGERTGRELRLSRYKTDRY